MIVGNKREEDISVKTKIHAAIDNYKNLIAFPGETLSEWEEKCNVVATKIKAIWPLVLNEDREMGHILASLDDALERYKKELPNIHYFKMNEFTHPFPTHLDRMIGIERRIIFGLWYSWKQPTPAEHFLVHLKYLREAYQIYYMFAAYTSSTKRQAIDREIGDISRLVREIEVFYRMVDEVEQVEEVFHTWCDGAKMYHILTMDDEDRHDIRVIVPTIQSMEDQSVSSHWSELALSYISAGEFSKDDEGMYFEPPHTVSHLMSKFSHHYTDWGRINFPPAFSQRELKSEEKKEVDE